MAGPGDDSISSMKARLTFRDLDSTTWKDLEKLFGPRGACGGCWCMAYRVKTSVYHAGKGARNKEAFKRLALKSAPTGVLAYDGGDAVGWCAVAPRQDFEVLSRSRVLAALDDKPVWSVTCFFVARSHRGRGVATALAGAAARYAAARGATLVEGYPVLPSKRLPDTFAWTGLPGVFEKAGYHEAGRRSPRRPIMRRAVRPTRP